MFFTLLAASLHFVPLFFVPLQSHHCRIDKPVQVCRLSIVLYVPLRSTSINTPKPPHLPCPKKTSLRGKNRASPAVNGRQPQPSFRYAPLRAIRVCHPRSTRRRLAPLHYASKKSLRYHFADFLLASFRLKAVLPALFLLRPRQPPTPHP
jgi:hypothetical protein